MDHPREGINVVKTDWMGQHVNMHLFRKKDRHGRESR